jgi:hypothetical protein
MKRLRVTSTPDPVAAPALFGRVADSPHASEV